MTGLSYDTKLELEHSPIDAFWSMILFVRHVTCMHNTCLFVSLSNFFCYLFRVLVEWIGYEF